MRCSFNFCFLNCQALVIFEDDGSFLFLLYNSVIFCLDWSSELGLEILLILSFILFSLCLGKLCPLVLQFDCESGGSLLVFCEDDVLLVVEVRELLGQLLLQSVALDLELKHCWL